MRENVVNVVEHQHSRQDVLSAALSLNAQSVKVQVQLREEGL